MPTNLGSTEVEIPVGDEPPVLHGAGGEVRNGDHVVLLEGVGHVEEVLVEGERSHCHLQGKLSLVLFAQRRVHLEVLIIIITEIPPTIII